MYLIRLDSRKVSDNNVRNKVKTVVVTFINVRFIQIIYLKKKLFNETN